jgi:hypothetical protein
MPSFRIASAVRVSLVFAALISARVAAAQQYSNAPSGAHQAGRASDTGHNAVTPSGSYTASIPLDLPAARGGIPLPLSIVSSGNRVGAAGLGWDVPLSYLVHTNTLTNRRPSFSPGDEAFGRITVVVTLNGSNIEFVPRGLEWVPRREGQAMVLRLNPDHTWTLEDGNGLTYVFARLEGLDRPTGLFMLTTIRAQGSANRLDLSYLPTQLEGDEVVVDLSGFRYNHAAEGGCAKHSVTLAYDNTPAPIGLSHVDGGWFVRTRTLKHVDLNAVPRCGQSGQRISRTELEYEPDAMTGLPRLRAVKMSGRQGPGVHDRR